jgi:hypothetical protein
VISLKCLGEVHRFSAWRALGAILLGILAMIGMAIGVLAAIWLAVVAARANSAVAGRKPAARGCVSP